MDVHNIRDLPFWGLHSILAIPQVLETTQTCVYSPRREAQGGIGLFRGLPGVDELHGPASAVRDGGKD